MPLRISGTSGCPRRGLTQTYQIQKYVTQNYERLSEEAAQGRGEHSIALASLLGCAKESYTIFQKNLHLHYLVLFPHLKLDHTKNFLQKIENVIQRSPVLSTYCYSDTLP